MLTLFWVVIPCSVVWMLTAIVGRSWKGWLIFVLSLISSLAGIATDKIVRPPFPPLPVDYNAVLRVLTEDVFYSALSGDRGMIYVIVMSSVMLLHGALRLVRVVNRKKIGIHDQVLFAIICIHWSALLLPVVSGYLVYTVQFRYSYPVAIMPIAWIALVLVHFMTRRQLVVANIFSLLFSVLAIFSLYSLTSQSIVAANQPKGLGKCLMDHNLTAGFSDYWFSKLVIMQSDYHVSMVSLHEGGEILLNGSSVDWLVRSVDGTRPFKPTFIVVNLLDKVRIEQRFGKPIRVIDCNGYIVWAYDHSLEVNLDDVIKPYPGPIFNPN